MATHKCRQAFMREMEAAAGVYTGLATYRYVSNGNGGNGLRERCSGGACYGTLRGYNNRGMALYNATIYIAGNQSQYNHNIRFTINNGNGWQSQYNQSGNHNAGISTIMAMAIGRNIYQYNISPFSSAYIQRKKWQRRIKT